MFTIKKEFKFEASHQLLNHDGKCKRLHGHSWRFTVVITGEKLNAKTKTFSDIYTHDFNPKENMLIDYSDISGLVKPIVEQYLDHWHLNDTLKTDMPTSEYLAKWLYDMLALIFSFPTRELRLEEIIVNETCTSECIYNPWK